MSDFNVGDLVKHHNLDRLGRVHILQKTNPDPTSLFVEFEKATSFDVAELLEVTKNMCTKCEDVRPSGVARLD